LSQWTPPLTIKRALRLIDRLKNLPGSPKIDRVQRRLFEKAAQAAKITPIRNVLEHIDQKITSLEFADGESHMLDIDEACAFVEIGRHRLTFVDLAILLKRLHVMALACARYSDEERAPGRE
jgi:hypothetical protein